MNHIKLLSRDVDVASIRAQLAAHPELWNLYGGRRAGDSPHRELDDLWARWAPPEVDSRGEHDAVWYPTIRERLPAVVSAAYGLMRAFQGDRLGGVLVTRIPPGRQCYPHVDTSWHAAYYQKFALQIEAADSSAFHFNEGSLVTQPGDLFWFDNSHTHWVTNPSDKDRVTLIVCIKTDWRP